MQLPFAGQAQQYNQAQHYNQQQYNQQVGEDVVLVVLASGLNISTYFHPVQHPSCNALYLGVRWLPYGLHGIWQHIVLRSGEYDHWTHLGNLANLDLLQLRPVSQGAGYPGGYQTYPPPAAGLPGSLPGGQRGQVRHTAGDQCLLDVACDRECILTLDFQTRGCRPLVMV